ncbi:MAG: RnfABCDGE type electron transport complex subunit B [Clostridia bacterium]|nr:RnfABCDGE type electron transport complex subunit B [Clostridia bacterium]
MISVLYAFLLFAGISLILGAMLAIASKIFAVKVDPRIPEVVECLPGANCGGCGFSGCSACAEAIVRGDAKVSACPVGGQQAADKIASVMGVDAGTVVRMRAQVLCSGTHNTAKEKYNYEGPYDCAAAMRLGGGPKECPNGCIGFGSCVVHCTNHAITVINGVAVVDPEKCAGCGVCVETCPKHIIKLIPFDAKVHVGCSSPDKGPLVKSYCDAGCIGCRLCTKVCESGAIHADGFLASIDYEKCTSCGKCAEKCPRKIIFVQDGTYKIEA